MPNAWDRREGESSPAYEAFNAYILMGLGRSNRAVGLQLGKSKVLIDRWSSRDKWVERAAAWDRHQAEHAHRAATRVVRSEAEKWARREQKLREQYWLAMGLTVKLGREIRRDAAGKGRTVSEAEIRTIHTLTDAASTLAEKALNGMARGDAEAAPRLTIPGSDERKEP